MNLYENLVLEWGKKNRIPITFGNKEICRIQFIKDAVTMQIDLDPSGENIVLGCNLGSINPGPYRILIFKKALKTNGFCKTPRGILAFSSKLNSLMLFDFLPLAHTQVDKLDERVMLFKAHAKVWVEALKNGQVPQLSEEQKSASDQGIFGIKR
jgi:hypothetical protein